MITLSRKQIRVLRSVFRRALNITSRSTGPPVKFVADSNSLKIQAVGEHAAVEYCLTGDFVPQTFSVSFSMLADCKGGRAEPVQLRCENEVVTAEWTDAGIPQVVRSARLDAAELPPLPERMEPNQPQLLEALRDAVETTAAEGTRYALHHLRLRGDGQIAASDGRQLLVQGGFIFPWEGELLIPANRLLAGSDLNGGKTVEIGQTEDWATLRSGVWTVWLKIEKEARFPQVDDLLPAASAACSTLHLSNADAQFLAHAVKRLPSNDEFNMPVTVDLNGVVAVRAMGANEAKPTEVVLTGSRRDGDTIRFSTNREYLARATHLGFRSVHISGQESPACSRDQQRTYVWAVLGKAGIIPSDPEATRIESPTSQHTTAISQKRTKSMITSKPEHAPKQAESSQTETASVDSLIESAETVKASLRESASQVTELIAALKRHRRQSKTLQSALLSIRALQAIDA